jgi:Formiminotransferase domain, N-terminal subdomain
MKALLGCNVYISAGACQRHIPILLDLLKGTQERCLQQSTTTNEKGRCVVVHAFSDVVYNRSSIHLAANCEDLMTKTVSDLVCRARLELLASNEARSGHDGRRIDNKNVVHPYVGLVDHVSVMPLVPVEIQPQYLMHDRIDTPWGRSARAIGEILARTYHDVNVVYYGAADPDRTPLAEVRRKKTNFFQSGGLSESNAATRDRMSSSSSSSLSLSSLETTIVGAPSTFVENFNIRLTSGVDKQTAQSLTRSLRHRNGGILGVEALTLPYSHGRYEVACNILKPTLGSVEDIQNHVEKWARNRADDLVETAYRVGTTADQCLQALELASSLEETAALEQHNTHVWHHFETYLSSNSR